MKKTDNFDSTHLGLDWMTMRTAASDLYSLTDNPGYLSMKFGESPASEMKTPAFVCRRMQHHKFEYTTKIYFNPDDDSEAAGLLLYKDEKRQYFFAVQKSEKGRKILLNEIGDNSSEIISVKLISNEDSPIKLKVKSLGTHYEFFYSIGDSNWEILCDNVSAKYLSTANSYDFTGTTIGMYAVIEEFE